MTEQWSSQPIVQELAETVGFDVLERLAEVVASRNVVVAITVSPYVPPPGEQDDS